MSDEVKGRAEWATPKTVWEEYKAGVAYKQSIGTRGLYDQNRMNERFYVGDQWHGASTGSSRPLVRYNLIKRIGDFKQAVIGAAPVAVNYSAEGVPHTLELKQKVSSLRDRAAAQSPHSMEELVGEMNDVPTDVEINLVMSGMSDYFRVSAERVRLDEKKSDVLRTAYVSGTGILYTYWDAGVQTGLYADEGRRQPLTGDIACEVLDVENVYFGNPSAVEVESQPYILAVQRVPLADVKREAEQNGRPAEEIAAIGGDKETSYMAGELGGGAGELTGAEYVTVITKFYKDYSGDTPRLMAVKVTEKATVREAWDVGIACYPFAVFRWEERKNSAYGDSEVTYLIPNQIAVNRMITAAVWDAMMTGMPIMVVNGDIVTDQVTNEPGQVIKVYGSAEDAKNAIGFVQPAAMKAGFTGLIEQMIAQTMTQAGANDAALGDVRPDNTSAIIAVREAATMPLQMMQNRFYGFVERVARIWAEFWLKSYGNRALKVVDDTGTWYLPFEAERYRDMLISTRVDVGASGLWSEAQSIATLDNLFERQIIDVQQYLERLPSGVVPNLSGLLRELQEKATPPASGAESTEPAEQLTGADVLGDLPEEALAEITALPPEVQAQILGG